MKKKELVSIIVPVFNTGEYLRECLKSLEQQTYENLEIIMINDGSTDHSGDICREYSRKDSRFILIEQENQGLSMSRNIGLEHARGKKVCFVDSDDLVHEKYVEILYENLVRFHADISMCSYLKFRGKTVPHGNVNNVYKKMSPKQMLYAITTTGPDNSSEKVVVAWNKMIRMDIIERLRFKNRFHEDEFMINDLLLNISSGVYTDAILYFYRQRSESITGEMHKKDLRHLDVLDAVYDRLLIFSGPDYKELFPDMLRSYFENSTIIYYDLISCENFWKVWKKIIPRYLAILLKNRKKLKQKQFLRYGLFLISPTLYRKKYW